MVAAATACLSLAGCGQLNASPRPIAGATPSPSAVATHSPQWVPAAEVATVATGILDGLKAPCSVQLEMYELGNPTLITALKDAHRSGCSVQVELDATESQSIASVPVLRQAGIQVRTVHVANHGIDHIKALVINGGSQVLIGGVNWGRYSSYTTDADVLIFNDPAIAQGLAIDWTNSIASFSGGATSPQALEGPSIATAIKSLIGNAHHRVLVITNYLTSYGIQDALAAAVRRGVTVDVVLNKSGYGAASAATWLSAHGVHVRLAPTSPYLHAKVILTDSAGIIGSANLSYDGLHVNRELDTPIPASLIPAATSWADTIWATATPSA